jgi:hypothetical protein
MKVEIAEAAFPAALAGYSPISIAFEVSRVYDVSDAPWNGVRFLLTERSLASPYEKDYDSVAGDPPRDWARRFDLSRWARSRGCVELKVETQNINVPACLFYAGQGCQLRTVNRGAYPDLPHEIQLLWHKDLSREEDAPRP